MGQPLGQSNVTVQPSTGEARAVNDDALTHLGNVLYFLADLHPDDRCEAIDNALAFYNRQRPGAQVTPSGMQYDRLVRER